MRLISGKKTVSCHTSQLVLSEPPTFEGMQQIFRQMKKFCISQVSMVTSLGGGGLQFVLLHRVVGCWRGYLFGARCRLAYGPADATATHCLLLQ